MFWHLLPLSFNWIFNLRFSFYYVRYKDAYSTSPFFTLKVFVGFIIVLLGDIFGLTAFFLPLGIYIATKYFFTGYSLIDNRSHSIGEDATFAAHVSKNVLWRILGLIFIYFIVFFIAVFISHQLSDLLFTSIRLWMSTFEILKTCLFSPPILLTSIHAYKQLVSSMSTEETPTAAQAEGGPSQT